MPKFTMLDNIHDMECEIGFQMDKYRIPGHMQESLKNYILFGTPVGHFLTALLSNDLFEAVGRADDINQRSICDYVKFLYNEAPGLCMGSYTKVWNWVEKGGFINQRNG